MYQNVIYIIYRINDALLHCIGNLMGLRDRDLWIHFYIKGNHIEIPYHSWPDAMRITGTGHFLYSLEYLIIYIDIFHPVH